MDRVDVDLREAAGKLDHAVRSVVELVLADPIQRGAVIIGCGVQILREQGLSRDAILSIVVATVDSLGSVEAAFRRAEMKVVETDDEDDLE